MKFDAIDAALLDHLATGRRTFTGMQSRAIMALAEAASRRPGDGFRVVDRRLQALRKAGKVKFVRGSGAGWELT